MRRSLLNLCLLFLLPLVAIAETGSVERADGTRITYYLDVPVGSDSYPLAVILQGSECLRVSDKYEAFITRLRDRGVAVLRVEKPGLTAETAVGDCPEEYLRLNVPDRRVLDLLAVLGELRRTQPGWNGDLGVSGGSEGAMISSLVAPLTPSTKAVLLFSGGGGWNFSQEVAGSIALQMEKSGASADAVEQQMERTRAEWEAVRREPVASKEWASDGKLGRNTYQWWNQSLDRALYRPLLQVDVPILSYQGHQDQSVPAQSAAALQARFKEAGKANLELRSYQGDHGPPDEVMREGFDWLAGQLGR